MVSYLSLVTICLLVAAISVIATMTIARSEFDGVLRVITSDTDDGTYTFLESNKQMDVIAKKKYVRFLVRHEHYKSQE